MWQRFLTFVLSLFKRSLRTHSSIVVSNRQQALAFYKMLGFRQVMSSRADEVTLLRNHRGDELNVVTDPNRTIEPASVAFEIRGGLANFADLVPSNLHLKILEDAATRRIVLRDPDGHRVEFFETLDKTERSAERLFHLVTADELEAGLSEHFYMPPPIERRFVRAPSRSAFMSIACQRVAEECGRTPLLLEMNTEKLSLEEALDTSEIGMSSSASTYPHVHSPIAREAILSVGVFDKSDDEYLWPTQQQSLASWVAA